MNRIDWQGVYWIGGSPCAGKSSIAELLAGEYGLRVYHIDEAYQRLEPEVTPLQPNLYKWKTSPWDTLWMQPPENLLQETIACYREQLELVLGDLQDLDASHAGPVTWLVEGTSLLPDALTAMGICPPQAIWIVPEENFQHHHYAQRGDWLHGILSTCQNPEQAFENWMSRDAAFARWVQEQTRQRGLNALAVDGKRSLSENAAMVAKYFRLALPRTTPEAK